MTAEPKPRPLSLVAPNPMPDWRATSVLCQWDPEAQLVGALMHLPAATAVPTFTVSAEVVPVADTGSNDPVTPAGALPKLSVTGPLKFVRVMMTVVTPFLVSAADVSDSV